MALVAVPKRGRVAQRESTSFTRMGSQVQSLSRPPFKSLRACLGRLFYFLGGGLNQPPRAFVPFQRLNDGKIDRLFEATADSVQEAVLDALITAEAVTGFAGHHRPALREVLSLVAFLLTQRDPQMLPRGVPQIGGNRLGGRVDALAQHLGDDF